MNLKWCVVFAFAVLGSLLCSQTIAADWPQIEKRLAAWDGVKEVQLPAGVSPIDDPLFAPVVEMLLRKGFAVRPATGEHTTDGLVLAQHHGAGGDLLVLTRARDGALLALEPFSDIPDGSTVTKNRSDAGAAEAQELSTPDTGTAQSLRIESDSQGHRMGTYPSSAPVDAEVLVDMPGTPRSIAAWRAPQPAVQGFHVFALYDTRLVHFCYQSGDLKQIAEFISPSRVSRALRLESGDFDGDGRPELAPVWVEDIYSVDEGTESRIHSWIVDVHPDGDMQAQSADLEGYLSVLDGQIYLQRRGAYSSFTPALYAIEFKNGVYRSSSAPALQSRYWVYNHARWPDAERVLIWNDDQRLVLAARSGRRGNSDGFATGTLLSDFGTYLGASIYVPLEEPEYRSGFSAHDRVMVRNVRVPRRMLSRGESVFTLARGREAGLPLVGKPSGRDRVVRIDADRTGLKARFPFTPVNAFILDFDIVEHGGGELGAMLLLNENADGTGRSYLQIQ